jgi:predicted alpha/beta hydrolase family esterase
MLTILNKKNRSNLIVFIHGFTAGKGTWIRNDKSKTILDYLIDDENVSIVYDFAIFEYHTKLVDWFSKIRSILPAIGIGKSENNNLIEDIANILQTEIKYKCANYENIVLITHSMGGLVAKKYILDKIKSKEVSNLKLFICLAVPHRGTDLATFAKLFLRNVQVNSLRPLSDTINTMTDDWVSYSQDLPDTLYVQGQNDQIVLNESTIGVDARKKAIVFSNHDHFSITRPESENDIVIVSIKHELLKPIVQSGKDHESKDDVFELYTSLINGLQSPRDNVFQISRIANSSDPNKKIYLQKLTSIDNISMLETDAIGFILRIFNKYPHVHTFEMSSILQGLSLEESIRVKSIIPESFNENAKIAYYVSKMFRYWNRKNHPAYKKNDKLITIIMYEGLTEEAIKISREIKAIFDEMSQE